MVCSCEIVGLKKMGYIYIREGVSIKIMLENYVRK